MKANEILRNLDVTENTPILVVRVSCQGEALETDGDVQREELARILRNLAADIENGLDFSTFRSLRDYNGNVCGKATIKPVDYWTRENRLPSA